MGASLIRGLLDTSVLIGAEAKSLPDEAAISTVTLAELHFGVLMARNDDVRRGRLRRLAEVETRFEAIPVDGIVARSYGSLAHIVMKSGRGPQARTMDILIAATAHAHGVALFTRNRKDFKALDKEIDIKYL